MKIEVISYNPIWPIQFESEKSAIESSLGDVVVGVHHVGSTAVEGLAAKPIIDIILEVRSLESLDQSTPKLELMGYEAKGEFGIPGRRYFRKGRSQRTHQIHTFKTGDHNIFRHLAFRDYLSRHPDARREYQELKIKLAMDCNDDLDFYCDGKDTFVKHHEARAIEWKKGVSAGKSG